MSADENGDTQNVVAFYRQLDGETDHFFAIIRDRFLRQVPQEDCVNEKRNMS